MKKGIKDIVAPQGMFEDLGPEVPRPGRRPRRAGRRGGAAAGRRSFGGPVLVHVITQKGRGYDHARNDEGDQFHAVGMINPETGLPLRGLRAASGPTSSATRWSRSARERDDVVGDHRGDAHPRRARRLRRRLPGPRLRRRHRRAARRDHGLRAGLRRAAPGRRRLRDLPQPGLRPAAHGLRAAPGRRDVRARPRRHHRHRRRLAQRHVGHDARPRIVPGLRLAAPRDGEQVSAALREAVDVSDAPTVLRFPKGDVRPSRCPPCARLGSVDVLHEPAASADEAGVDLLLVGVGQHCRHRADRGGEARGPGPAVRGRRPALGAPGQPGPRRGWPAQPVPWRSSRTTSRSAGWAPHVAAALTEAGVDVPVHQHGIPTSSSTTRRAAAPRGDRPDGRHGRRLALALQATGPKASPRYAAGLVRGASARCVRGRPAGSTLHVGSGHLWWASHTIAGRRGHLPWFAANGWVTKHPAHQRGSVHPPKREGRRCPSVGVLVCTGEPCSARRGRPVARPGSPAPAADEGTPAAGDGRRGPSRSASSTRSPVRSRPTASSTARASRPASTTRPRARARSTATRSR